MELLLPQGLECADTDRLEKARPWPSSQHLTKCVASPAGGSRLTVCAQQDESLQRWKASLGLGGGTGNGGQKKVILQTLFLESPTLPQKIVLDLTQSPAELAKLKKEPSRFDRRSAHKQLTDTLHSEHQGGR